VSVNVYGNARTTLLKDSREWQVAPQWNWGVGTAAQLASVWKRYHIAVVATPKKVKGTIVHDVAHTEASYLIDAAGYERALFLWPYREAAVALALKDLG